MKVYQRFSGGFHFFSFGALYVADGLTFTAIAQNTAMFVCMDGTSTFIYSIHKDYDSVVLFKAVLTKWWLFCVLKAAVCLFGYFIGVICVLLLFNMKSHSFFLLSAPPSQAPSFSLSQVFLSYVD